MRTVLRLLLIALVPFVLVACGEPEEPLEELDVVPDPSPQGIDELPEDVNEAALTITGGMIDEERISLLANEATIIEVTNNDDVAYRIQIGDIVPGEEIPASTTMELQFTSGDPEDNIEGQLLPAEGEDPLDTFTVEVRVAGGVRD